MRAFIGIVALVVPLAVVFPAPAGPDQRLSRVIDETVSCSVPGLVGGVREIEVEAGSGVRHREDTSKWRALARASVAVPTTAGGHVSLSAGGPAYVEPGLTDTNVRLRIHAACVPSRVRVPLARAGLEGGPAGVLGDAWDCAVPRRVLVRVRAVFRRPTRLRIERRTGFGLTVVSRVAKGTIRSGSLAVRTPGGKSISYADVHESGRARLFVARSCVPD
jgi:hypothetical protein